MLSFETQMPCLLMWVMATSLFLISEGNYPSSSSAAAATYVCKVAADLAASLGLTAARQLLQTAPSLRLTRPHQCFAPHTMLLAIVMSDSSSVPAAPAVKSSSARCQPVTVESRCPCDARRWPRMTLVIALLSSVCYVSAAQGTWSAAQLSVARNELAATSVGNVAIFAGGKCCCWCLFCR